MVWHCTVVTSSTLLRRLSKGILGYVFIPFNCQYLLSKNEFLAIFCRIVVVTTLTTSCQTVSVLPWRHSIVLCPDWSSLETISTDETKSKQKKKIM